MTTLGFARKMIGVSPLPMIVSRLRPGLRVVLYHHVGDENDLTRCLGCTTSEETFESHVDWFSRNYDVVSLSDVLSDRPLPPRALLITFDDAYRSVLRNAGRILGERDLPSVLFMVTDPVFRGRMVLDNLLSFARCRKPALLEELAGGPSDDPVRRILFRVIPEGGTHLRNRIRDVLEEECGKEARRLADDVDLYLGKGDLRDLEAAGIELARHTASHVTPSLLDDPVAEVDGEWVECGLDPHQKAFSFPFGALAEARRSMASLVSLGLGPFFLVEGCSNRNAGQVYFRVSPRDQPLDSVMADLEVLAPLRRILKRRMIADLEASA
jgi:peptidoglycan/xylan/chitin deacetylase (PgdA/CDA1 family)